MIYISGLVMVFLAARLLISLVNLLTRQWLPPGTPAITPLVSVLIPARNEEHNIERLLNSLLIQDYPKLEIIVYDDLSEDNTAGLVQRFCDTDDRVRLVRGEALPGGWLGKNFACHKLSLEAKGAYLLFLDADVIALPQLIGQAVAFMEKHRLALLSIFPQQLMQSFGERITVPLMTWILVSLLPLKLTRDSRRPSLSAANGQFMLFEAEMYRKHSFHMQVKNAAVEDIMIFKQIKHHGLKGHTLLSNGQIKCRMYKNFDEAVKGFSKNIFYFFGNHPPLTFLFALTTTFGFIPIMLAPGGHLILLWIAGEVAVRITVAAATRQNAILLILLAPMQQLALIWMVIAAYNVRIRRQLQWKGRPILEP